MRSKPKAHSPTSMSSSNAFPWIISICWILSAAEHSRFQSAIARLQCSIQSKWISIPGVATSKGQLIIEFEEMNGTAKDWILTIMPWLWSKNRCCNTSQITRSGTRVQKTKWRIFWQFQCFHHSTVDVRRRNVNILIFEGLISVGHSHIALRIRRKVRWSWQLLSTLVRVPYLRNKESSIYETKTFFNCRRRNDSEPYIGNRRTYKKQGVSGMLLMNVT